jgi:CDP-diacylglycerol---serine O-phosphatidyltransferase
MHDTQNTDKFIVRLNLVDLLTLTGVVSSWLAIQHALTQQISGAIAWLFIAMLTDAFDGILARKYNTERPFGCYLDGFMDQIIYLLAPSIVLYQWGFNGWYNLALIAMMICGAVRLSVFNEIGNVKGKDDQLKYLGMPVLWSLPIIGIAYLLHFILGMGVTHFLLAFVLISFSVAMVWQRPFFKFKSLKVIVGTIGSFILIFFSLHFTGH